MEYEKYLKKIVDALKNSTKKQRFFAVAVLFFVAAAVLFFINPAKKLLEMRNSQRRTDVVNILNAVYQFSLDDNGDILNLISSEPTMICRSDAKSCEGLVDLSRIIESEKKLLSKIPVDPKENDANKSGYQIFKLQNGRISVKAPLAENNAVITISK